MVMVVLKELIWLFNSLYFGRVYWSVKELIFLVFVLWEGVVAFIELIFNSFYIGMVLWFMKELISNIFYFGRPVVVPYVKSSTDF